MGAEHSQRQLTHVVDLALECHETPVIVENATGASGDQRARRSGAPARRRAQSEAGVILPVYSWSAAGGLLDNSQC